MWKVVTIRLNSDLTDKLITRRRYGVENFSVRRGIRPGCKAG